MNGKYTTDQYLIIDWGTTNFRVFLMSNDGELIKKHETSMGLLQIQEVKENDKFAVALKKILKAWLPNYQNLPIFMAGMIGSVNGWHTVNYVKTKTTITTLIDNTFRFQLPWNSNAFIVPGISHHNQATGCLDVMRGEEIQVFGVLEKCQQQKLSIILPGTHSKHVSVEKGQITSITSFMTGELFSIINQHSILCKALPTQHFNQETFTRGVNEGQTSQLTQVLFQARTHNLFNIIKKSHIESYLSGLLIGNELQAVTTHSVYLIGSQSLCEKYQLACETLNISATYLDGNECFLLGMNTLVKSLNSTAN